MVIFVYSPLVFILKQFDIKNLESENFRSKAAEIPVYL